MNQNKLETISNYLKVMKLEAFGIVKKKNIILVL